MLTLACMYRSGGDFVPADVKHLMGSFLQLNREYASTIRTLCLTDKPDEIAPFVDIAVKMEIDWPCWWGKMELFRIPPPVLYFDLDMMIVGELGPLLQSVNSLPDDELLLVRGFYRNDPCSTILGWNCNMRWLTETFFLGMATEHNSVDVLAGRPIWTEQSHGIGCTIGGMHFLGDQDFIAMACTGIRKLVYAQDYCTGIYSYKVHIQKMGVLPADARMVVFHGRPRPSEIRMPARRHDQARPLPAGSQIKRTEVY